MRRIHILQELGAQGKSREIDFSSQEEFDMIMEWMHGEETCQQQLPEFYASCVNARIQPEKKSGDIGFADDVAISFPVRMPETGSMFVEGRTCLTDKPCLLVQRMELIDGEGQVIRQSSEAEMFQDDRKVFMELSKADWDKAAGILYCAVWKSKEGRMEGRMAAGTAGLWGEGGPGIKSVILEKPSAKNGRDTVVVLYNRRPGGNERDFDYCYPEKIEEGKQRTYLELECTVQMMEDAVIRRVDYGNILLKLICPGRGMVQYGKKITEKVFPLLGLPEEERRNKDFKIEFLDKGADGNWSDWGVPLPNERLPIRDKVDLELRIPYELVNGLKGTLVVSSSLEETGANLWKADKLYLLWGCLEENTRIEMADGSSKCIRDIRIGESVRGKNGFSKVLNIIQGQEEQLLCIETAGGVRICSTEDHIFCTSRGNIKAGELCGADLLKTTQGDAAITGIYPVKGGTVYNLDLEGDGFFYAEGIQNGDFKNQNRLFCSRKAILSPEVMQLGRELNRMKELMKE